MANEASMNRRQPQSGVPVFLIRLVLGGLFVYMGISKAQHPIEFLKQVRLYHALPESPPYYLNGTAIVLPWLEIVCGAALIIGVGLRGGAIIVIVMLLVFTPAILIRAVAMQRELGIPFTEVKFDCGCGAGIEIIWQKLSKNLAFLAMAILVLFWRNHRFAISNLCRSTPACL